MNATQQFLLKAMTDGKLILTLSVLETASGQYAVIYHVKNTGIEFTKEMVDTCGPVLVEGFVNNEFLTNAMTSFIVSLSENLKLSVPQIESAVRKLRIEEIKNRPHGSGTDEE